MDDGQALLAGIGAAPEDDAPRLAYADWLDDHDQPERAEFIRIQCELARPEGSRAHRTVLRRRERDLLVEHRAEWTKAFRPGIETEFRRGFVERVSCDISVSTDPLPKEIPNGIVRDVRIFGRRDRLAEAISNLSHIHTLRLPCLSLDYIALDNLIQRAFPNDIRVMDLRWNNLMPGVIPLLSHHRLNGVEMFWLGGNHLQVEDRDLIQKKLGSRVSFDAERPPATLYEIQADINTVTGLDAEYHQIIMILLQSPRLLVAVFRFDLDGVLVDVKKHDGNVGREIAARIGLRPESVKVRRFFDSETNVGIRDFGPSDRDLIDDPPNPVDPQDPAPHHRAVQFATLKEHVLRPTRFQFGELLD